MGRGDSRDQPDRPGQPDDGRVLVRRGSFYLGAGLFERCFGGADTVAVVGRGDEIALLPLREPGSGGLLVKRRNARGDRVIHAPELLRELGVDEADEHELDAAWDPEQGALVVPVPRPPRSPAAGANDNGR